MSSTSLPLATWNLRFLLSGSVTSDQRLDEAGTSFYSTAQRVSTSGLLMDNLRVSISNKGSLGQGSLDAGGHVASGALTQMGGEKKEQNVSFQHEFKVPLN